MGNGKTYRPNKCIPYLNSRLNSLGKGFVAKVVIIFVIMTFLLPMLGFQSSIPEPQTTSLRSPASYDQGYASTNNNNKNNNPPKNVEDDPESTDDDDKNGLGSESTDDGKIIQDGLGSNSTDGEWNGTMNLSSTISAESTSGNSSEAISENSSSSILMEQSLVSSSNEMKSSGASEKNVTSSNSSNVGTIEEVTVPAIVSTNHTTIIKFTESENPKVEPMVATNNTESSAASKKNSTTINTTSNSSHVGTIKEEDGLGSESTDDGKIIQDGLGSNSTDGEGNGTMNLSSTISAESTSGNSSEAISENSSSSILMEQSLVSSSNEMKSSGASEKNATSSNSSNVGTIEEVTVPAIVSTNHTTIIKFTESENPKVEPMVATNNTESSAASKKNSTTINTTSNSSHVGTIEEATDNDSSPVLAPLNKTDLDDELSPENRQYALWKATSEKFEATKPWKNSSTFTTVDRDVFQQLTETAHVSVKAMVEEVYTDCEMYILPATDEVGGFQNETPRVQYKCLSGNFSVLRDDLCHTVNMCRVVLDEEAWKDATGASISSNTTNTDSSVGGSSTKKSALLMIVNSVVKMMETNTFKGIINKASYAYRSNRPFYIWIGNLDQIKLNFRELELRAPSLGVKCAAKKLENSMDYYKPVAFLVLFDILSSSSPSSESIFYLDADTAFTPTAFERIDNDKFNNNISKSEDILVSMGPESYLDLSPQASLVGTQNLGGKVLISSGVIVLRNTRWSRDFSALWWYGRCGEKDELAMWLAIFATFSAWTATTGEEIMVGTEKKAKGPAQFAYPGEIFFEYAAAKNKLFMHFRKNGHKLQSSWKATVEQRRKDQSANGVETNDEDNYAYPIPTNTKLNNGGSEKLGPKFQKPMELPHVVILPPEKPVSYSEAIESTVEDGAGSTVQVDLPRLRSDASDAFVVKSKTLDSCSDGRCWPYAKQ